MINCKLMDGHLEDAIQQIQFLNEISQDSKSAQVAYLEALMHQKQNNNNESLKCLDESLRLHITSTKQLVPDLQFYISLNPNFLLTLSACYISLGSPAALGKSTKLLETITSKIPGYVNAHLLLSQSHYPQNPTLAIKSVQQALSIDSSNQDARIFQAMLNIKEGRAVFYF